MNRSDAGSNSSLYFSLVASLLLFFRRAVFADFFLERRTFLERVDFLVGIT